MTKISLQIFKIDPLIFNLIQKFVFKYMDRGGIFVTKM